MTIDISPDDIDQFICEKLINIPEDIFTLEYYLDMGSKGMTINDVKGLIILLVQKISPNVLLVVEFMCCEEMVAMNPIIAIVLMNEYELKMRSDDFPSQLSNYLIKDGVKKEFVDFLEGTPALMSMGDICYFSMDDEINCEGENSEFEDAVEDMRKSSTDIIFRFALIKKQGEEIRITPNMNFETKGYLKLRDIPKDCYVIKSPNKREYLGFARRKAEE
jgi:hypothetical protein